jgi:hypothetical protein
MFYQNFRFCLLGLLPAAILAASGEGATRQKDLNYVKNGAFEMLDVKTRRLRDWHEDGVAPVYRLDKKQYHGGAQALNIRFQSDFNQEGYSGAIQTIGAAAIAEKHLVLSGFFKRSNEASKVGLWLLVVDAAGKKLLYLNSYDKPIQATEWSEHRIEFDVPPTAHQIKLGAAIYDSNGDMWVDDVKLLGQAR